MMKQLMIAALFAVLATIGMPRADASTFTGYQTTSDVYFAGTGTVVADPTGASIFDLDALVDITIFAGPPITGYVTVFDGVDLLVDGTPLDTHLVPDGTPALDTLSALFALSTGPTPFAIATFIGDFDDPFLVLGGSGDLTIVGATAIPLPASMALLAGCLAALGGARRLGGRSSGKV